MLDDYELNYSGELRLSAYGEADEILFLSSLPHPLAEELHDKISGKRVSVRYWITDQPTTKEQATELAVRDIIGIADTDFGARYSEDTGYLWTDEKVNVGGHDLINELSSYYGLWLNLEITVHASK